MHRHNKHRLAQQHRHKHAHRHKQAQTRRAKIHQTQTQQAIMQQTLNSTSTCTSTVTATTQTQAHAHEQHKNKHMLPVKVEWREVLAVKPWLLCMYVRCEMIATSKRCCCAWTERCRKVHTIAEAPANAEIQKPACNTQWSCIHGIKALQNYKKCRHLGGKVRHVQSICRSDNTIAQVQKHLQMLKCRNRHVTINEMVWMELMQHSWTLARVGKPVSTVASIRLLPLTPTLTEPKMNRIDCLTCAGCAGSVCGRFKIHSNITCGCCWLLLPAAGCKKQ